MTKERARLAASVAWAMALSIPLTLTVICTTYVKVTKPVLGPEYVTINGKQMRCVAIQVTQTETAASCDWDAIRETD